MQALKQRKAMGRVHMLMIPAVVQHILHYVPGKHVLLNIPLQNKQNIAQSSGQPASMPESKRMNKWMNPSFRFNVKHISQVCHPVAFSFCFKPIQLLHVYFILYIAIMKHKYKDLWNWTSCLLLKTKHQMVGRTRWHRQKQLAQQVMQCSSVKLKMRKLAETSPAVQGPIPKYTHSVWQSGELSTNKQIYQPRSTSPHTYTKQTQWEDLPSMCFIDIDDIAQAKWGNAGIKKLLLEKRRTELLKTTAGLGCHYGFILSLIAKRLIWGTWLNWHRLLTEKKV